MCQLPYNVQYTTYNFGQHSMDFTMYLAQGHKLVEDTSAQTHGLMFLSPAMHCSTGPYMLASPYV